MHEAGELVAGEEHALEIALARGDVLQVVGVREHRAHEPLGIAELAQVRRAVLRMLVERGVALVVEVVQQRDVAPRLLVLAALRAHRRARRPRPRRRGAAAPRSPSSSAAARARRGGRARGSLHPWRGSVTVQLGPGPDCTRSRQRRRGASRRAVCKVPRGLRSTARAPSPCMASLTVMTRPRPQEFLVIEGGVPLHGTIRPEGNKNSALALLAATLLTAEPGRARQHAAHPRRRDDARAARRSRRRGRVDGPQRGARVRRRRQLDGARRGALRAHPRLDPARRPAARALRQRRRAAARAAT